MWLCPVLYFRRRGENETLGESERLGESETKREGEID